MWQRIQFRVRLTFSALQTSAYWQVKARKLCRGNGLVVGQRYAVYREADPYVFTDANGKKYTAALELQQVASGIAVRGEGDVTTLELTDSYNAEVRRSDRVLPEYDPMLPTLFYPVNAENTVAGGQIVRVLGSIGTAAVIVS